MSAISKCITAKIAEGLIDSVRGKQLLDRIKNAPRDEDALVQMKNLIGKAEKNLNRTSRQAYNQISNLEEVDHLVKTGSVRDINAKYLEGLDSQSKANLSILASHTPKTYELLRVKAMTNDLKARALINGELSDALYGNKSAGSDVVAAAKEIQKALEHGNLMLQDAGLPINEKLLITPLYRNDKIAAMSASEFRSFIENNVDMVRFNSAIEDQVRIAGGVNEWWTEAYTAWNSGFATNLKNNASDLKDIFRMYGQGKDAQSYLNLTNKLGSGDAYTDFTFQLDSISNRVARDQMYGSTKGAAKAVNDRVIAKMKESGRFTDEEILSTQKGLEERLSFAYGEYSHYPLSNPIYRSALGGLQALRSLSSTVVVGIVPVNVVSDQVLSKRYQQMYLGNNPEFTSQYLKNVMSRKDVAQKGLELAVLGDQLMKQTANYFDSGIGGSVVKGAQKWSGQAQIMSGMVKTTQATQQNAALATLTKLSSLAKSTDFDKLTPQDLKFLKLGNITPDDWKLLREVSRIDDDISMIDIVKISQSEDVAVRRLAAKLDSLVIRGRDIAVPIDSVYLKLQKAKAYNSGLIWGLLADNLTMFMSYPTTYTREYLLKPFDEGAKTGIQQAAATIAAMTVAGVIGYSGRQLLQGKKPDLTSADAWQYGLSNASGLAARFLGEAFSAQYPNAVSAAMGPVGMLPQALYDVVKDNIDRKLENKETKIQWDTLKAFWKMVPPAHPIKLVLDRLIYDQMQLILDPDGARNLRTRIKRQEKEGGGWWWRPGDDLTDVVD